MATREIYGQTFDEDVTSDQSATCVECGGQVRTNSMETACEGCGLLIDEQRIDHGPEWRNVGDEPDSQRRVGPPRTVARHDNGLSTEIGRWRDGNGNQLAGSKRARLSRMRREHSRGRFGSKAERNLAFGLGEVKRIAGALGLSRSIRDQACQLFRSAQSEELLRGRSLEAMAAGSVYGTCRCNGLGRTIEEIAALARVNQQRVLNAYKVLNTELGLPTQPVRPSGFVPRLASELGVSDQVRHRAQRLAEHSEAVEKTVGVRPSGFAAACLYTSAQEYGQPLTQRAAADAANVVPKTVRSHQNKLAGLSH
ncbi:transcription initiation factor IIB family protein [Halonotius terrestris]|uniref:Transcription initiation factor IIB family protein n=1 Tax=Halonotius terrestris TaxID=2487750 RepID=A0A8J8P643_9EURY|nr:transcription initiation factor IIB family protein [Halonotius terrestris]TQQ79184.1 transcription initiation factor IIB family protein [Halonotius terrestris]